MEENNKKSSRKTKRSEYVAVVVLALAIIVLAGLFSICLSDDPATTNFFSQIDTNSDFKVTDVAKRYIWQDYAKKPKNNGVIVVPFNEMERDSLAQLIHRINQAQPKVIGVDMFFRVRSNVDSLLLAEMFASNELVLPYDIYEKNISYFTDSLPENAHIGIMNIVENRREGICRSFRPFWGEDSVMCFPLMIASRYNPELVEQIKRRGNETEEINFTSGRPLTIDPSTIESNKDLIKDKIVLIGTTEGYDDLHITPVNNEMYGVMMHAYILSTIIDASYYDQLPSWILYSIVFVLAFSVAFVKCMLEKKRKWFKSLLWRVCQAMVWMVTIPLSYWAMLFCNYSIELKQALIFLALIGFVADILDGIKMLLRKIPAVRDCKIDFINEMIDKKA